MKLDYIEIPDECELAEIRCNGKIHDTLPRNCKRIIESAYLIATGKAPEYTITETTKPHSFDKRSFEESGSNIYYWRCFDCGLELSRDQYNQYLRRKTEVLSGRNTE